jgi:hypothetical protein
LEVDYHSPGGFCSADDLWIPFKNQNSPTCPYVDVLLIPGCEYQGTARGQGQSKGVGYTLVAEEGKIYNVIYPGNAKLYVGEIQPDERAATDTAGSAPAVVTTDTGAAPAATSVPAGSDKDTGQILPVSGQGRDTPMPFIIVSVVVILFLLGAGVVAMRKRGQPA